MLRIEVPRWLSVSKFPTRHRILASLKEEPESCTYFYILFFSMHPSLDLFNGPVKRSTIHLLRALEKKALDGVVGILIADGNTRTINPKMSNWNSSKAIGGKKGGWKGSFVGSLDCCLIDQAQVDSVDQELSLSLSHTHTFLFSAPSWPALDISRSAQRFVASLARECATLPKTE